ncbi:16S rRNA (cytidine(1402)-2'-O)-methyltransferase [Listeria monocytogenes]|uniref:Ribosomal RNA small subunit methyltransferase I n=1 Tax=Listeria monocytogenes TaxID=1639 RepID=A0A823IP93_LISMN|nr:16S rRNA (cytidine(1402)-2'-O)-methyltransferase [Listeria monocytogenes]EAF6702020.1 16S rRNA (cytidine(1402)-2'-O)-methyltransferase [Listeria monocytogenes]EAG9222124.1 16S rRNA (cytidine(1402)-2'-O)-methyltransferase [Listeria monocytogenes]EAG9291386.1 16S rRNA (cytidine(1402)-2'-O)-methyltransferase [Listeria monocytogenes]EAG9353989.1 16S rRNA (cytidine(1402)-2'-O)-methyltransferase [Listeria monocytogenes]EHR3850547.1 16S rRNA (cytidine(1402)-2'-O)-methyltransferase [Listeria monocy
MIKSQKSFSGAIQGALYLVPTPIGNLEDMTFRAIRMLKEADIIAAEDTRNTVKLLNHFEITTRMTSYHQFTKENKEDNIIQRMLDGEVVALVSDAGMPSISDPGYELVQSALNANIPVIPLPGANAALTALIASGLAPQPFYFYGFLPRQNKERTQAIEKLAAREETWILYESPHRLKETLKAIAKITGNDRKIVLCRELTKRFEEFLRGTVEDALDWTMDEEVRGEFCLIIEGNANPPLAEEKLWWQELDIKTHVSTVMEQENVSSKDAIKTVMKARNLPKREVYSAYHEIK